VTTLTAGPSGAGGGSIERRRASRTSKDLSDEPEDEGVPGRDGEAETAVGIDGRRRRRAGVGRPGEGFG
jgi:hypothetical protein